MTAPARIQPGPRMSQAVIHAGSVHLAGQVALGAPGASVTDQTRDILGRIDALLTEAGSARDKLISATIWLSDISSFAEMNAVWDGWVVPGATPARACVEARLAAPQFTVEIAIIAAL
ncbi:RidA family protein [Bosea sp. 685]|uniref:RidA family protein n=1 Tax=Bosea sp. 685 TaxID=3080057 RepID=UPI002892A745|nr:RidA family protein [Bosea sp. 685]WNJ92664.1 RidA family protein [Bosea sp. 685]